MTAVVIALLLCAACGDDDDAPDAGDVLAERLVAVLEAEGDAIDGDLEGADVSCPDVRAPAAGDRATCVVTLARGQELEIDVEFQDDGALTVVAVVPR